MASYLDILQQLGYHYHDVKHSLPVPENLTMRRPWLHRQVVSAAIIMLALPLLAGCRSAGLATLEMPKPDPALSVLEERLDGILQRGELPEIAGVTAEQRAALLHPEFGYVHDYAAWVDYVRKYNRKLEADYHYTTPAIIHLAADDPIGAAPRLDCWSRGVIAGRPGIETAFAEASRLLDELPVLAHRSQGVVPPVLPKGPVAADRVATALASVAGQIDRNALGTIPPNQRELIGFVLPWICRSSGKFVNHSKNAPTHDMTWTFHPSDPFAVGDAATSVTKTPVPRELFSVTGIARYLHALAGQPVPPEALFNKETGAHPQFTAAVDFAACRTAAAMLARLLTPANLDAFAASLAGAPPLQADVPGASGTILRAIDTPYGRVLVGGPGPNRYTDASVLAIIDLGGDDDYVFLKAQEGLGKRPLQVIVDLAGDDVYVTDGVGGPAAGILGISVLIDRAGNDRYIQGLSAAFKPREHGRRSLVLPDPEGVDTRLVPYVQLYGDPARPQEPGVALDAGFAFGAGFLGVGLLIDEAGDDLYLGQKYAFGAGFWSGIGVLHDACGNDVYAAGCAALGAGINGAFGLLDDRAGDDHYQCLGIFENSYSVGQEYDNGYTGQGIGMGSSWRAESRGKPRKLVPTLGGGVGLVYDTAGNDSYVG